MEVKKLKNKIPLFKVLSNYTDDDLKQLGAGMATRGLTSLLYSHRQIEGKRLDTLSAEPRDIKRTIQSLSTSSKAPNLIFIGCPNRSQKEIQTAATILQSKKDEKRTEL